MDLLCTVFKKKVARISNGLKLGGQINKRSEDVCVAEVNDEKSCDFDFVHLVITT